MGLLERYSEARKQDSGADRRAGIEVRVAGALELMGGVKLLAFLFRVLLAIVWKTFPATLALTANRFAVSFNYIPLTVACDTDHFSPP
jgi:hypothetical protein